MNRFLLIALCVVISSLSVSAQVPEKSGYRIEGRIKGLRDTTITLAHYFGYNQYIPKDTAHIDSTGRFVFEGTKTLPGGLYIAIPPLKKQRFIELVLPESVGTSFFSFDTDTVNITANMRVTGSPDTEAYYVYQKQLATFSDEAKALELQAQFRPDAIAKQNIRRELAELQRKVAQLQKKYIANGDSLLMAKLLRASVDPDVPAPPRLKNGKIDSTFQYRYYKNHFWDGFDFSDERMVRTPIFQRKIDRYLQELTAPTVDSLIKSADLIVSKARANKEVLSYAIWYITSQYERPRIMGTDGLFVHMAEAYYLSGVMPASDPATVDNIRKRVEMIKPLLIGKPFPALAVSDTLRQPVNLQAVKAEYTVLFFYDPTCTHCRESMPALKQFATDSVKSKGVQFCAIAVDNSPDAWQKFIREYGIQQWVNGYDFTFRTDYRKQYDVLKTPTVYVLDKDKRILARALPAEQVGGFIQFQRQQARQLAIRK
ncbi:thioredoxin-like domain-containing protein [Fibrella aquatica]|uniref:thioredoxin-like domain-containing protein n=1 Tax=Fibrella aquatica TaxID=3242487 RepID=UPI00351F88BE